MCASARAARPCACARHPPQRRPISTRRAPSHAPRAVDIDSRRDHRHTPPTARSRAATRRAGRHASHNRPSARRARRGVIGAVSSEPADRRRAWSAANTSLRRPAHERMSDGGQGDANSRSSAGHSVAGAPEWRGLERAPSDRIAQRVVEDGRAAHVYTRRET